MKSRRLICALFAFGFTMVVFGGAILVFSLHNRGSGGGGVTPGQFVAAARAEVAPALRFVDAAGQSVGLDGFKGRIVLLNLWATWCGPCIKEMAALDRLQAALGEQKFQVVALSQDRGGADVVLPFFKKLNLQKLNPYLDPAGEATKAFGVVGLPTSILIDREGREVGRLVGGVEWDVSPVRAMIESQLN
ncbi:cytochrome c biogenesis protein CcmG, thiol:disulfide interchange protein DsbE [Azospirillaceae bacterium]